MKCLFEGVMGEREGRIQEGGRGSEYRRSRCLGMYVRTSKFKRKKEVGCGRVKQDGIERLKGVGEIAESVSKLYPGDMGGKYIQCSVIE